MCVGNGTTFSWLHRQHIFVTTAVWFRNSVVTLPTNSIHYTRAPTKDPRNRERDLPGVPGIFFLKSPLARELGWNFCVILRLAQSHATKTTHSTCQMENATTSIHRWQHKAFAGVQTHALSTWVTCRFVCMFRGLGMLFGNRLFPRWNCHRIFARNFWENVHHRWGFYDFSKPELSCSV